MPAPRMAGPFHGLTNALQYNDSAVCGACVEVQGAQGTVVVRVVDLCPGCDTGQLDLSRQAFAVIDALSRGRVAIRWRVVSCKVTGNVSFHFKDGSSRWWTALQVRNHVLPVARLEWKDGASWVEMVRRDYNYFIASPGVGPDPFTVRVTAVDGQQIEELLPAPQSDLLVEGSGQFH